MPSHEEMWLKTKADVMPKYHMYFGWRLVGTILALISLVFFIVALVVFLKTRSSPNCYQVALGTGDVLGKAVNFKHAGVTYHTVAFLGIPFAANTAGDRRFRKPETDLRWQEALNATYKRKPCCQQISRDPEGFITDVSDTTEDCLHLNIWVPTDCMEKVIRYPVIFWAYGGGFKGGGNNYDIYDGRFVSGFGNLLIVVPNYRVGVFGFLNAGKKDAPGNVGIYDMLAAHRWVLEHIGQFGGDRENIVLAGVSAGSILSAFLMISPLVPSSFFSKAYLMSGSVFTILPANSNDLAVENFRRLVEKANCSTATTSESLLCLRAKTRSEILLAELNANVSFLPSHCDDILPSDVKSLMNSFDSSNKSILLSTTRSDGSSFFEDVFHKVVEQGLDFTPDMLQEILPTIFDYVDMNQLKSLLESLGGPYNISQDDYMGWKELIGDVMFRCPMEDMAELFGEKGAAVYFQEFWPKLSFHNHSGDYASHGDDASMLFGHPFLYPELATETEKNTSLRMIKTLARFAREGTLPVLEDGSQWPEYSKAGGLQVIDHRHTGYSKRDPNRSCSLARLVSSVIEKSAPECTV